MPDRAREATDKKLKQMEKQITKIYKQSEKELTEKWNAYMRESVKVVSNLQDEYELALKSGNAKKIKTAKKKFQTAVEEQTLNNKYYRGMVSATAEKITHANEIALAYVNDQMPAVYGLNYNAVAGDVRFVKNISFNMVDESTVKHMMTKNPKLIPYKKINHRKDYLYNLKKINSSVMQGILQGEGIDKIAGRLLPVVANNEASAIRNARTMTTSAENKGRFDSYEELESQGAVIEKVWIATPDERTRESHLELDGESVPVDEEFSNGLMYPADPDADDPAEVWNCRCTTRINIIGFKGENGDVSKVDFDRGETAHDKAIKAEKESRDEAKNKEEPEKTEARTVEKDPKDYTVDEIMKKVDDMPNAGRYDDEKKNLLPMAGEDGEHPASSEYSKLTEQEQKKFEKEAHIKIEDLYTEQKEIFVSRLEDLAESFDGKVINGIATKDEPTGITVAKYQGKLIVVDGNNRTNLAILKGQDEIDVMLIDLDEIRKKKKRR